MTPKIHIVLLLLLYLTISRVTTDEMSDAAKLNFTGFALKYGMSCEEYDVTTEDGYIIKLFHVPGDKTRPVLMTHGLMDSTDTFIIRGNTSIVYLLSKAGYDVWASNFRGNTYSRRHVTLNPDTDAAFWDFSMHEHGLYDLSASIDFVLEKTNADRLSLIGHSEGNVIMFILGSLRPEYNAKINVLIAWAPICYIHNIISGIPSLIRIPMIGLASLLRTILVKFDIREIMSYNFSIIVKVRDTCIRYPKLCIVMGYIIAGYFPDDIEPEYAYALITHFPSGTSRKNLDHYYQVLLSEIFAQYDYGPTHNLIKYNSEKPPVYNLTKVTVKVAMFLAENDYFSTQKDVSILRKELPHIVFYRVFGRLRHIDFPVSRTAYQFLYPSVLKLLKKYT